MPYRKLCSAPHRQALSGKGVTQIMKPLRLAPPLSKRSKTMHPPGYRKYVNEFLSRTTIWAGQILLLWHGPGTPKNGKARYAGFLPQRILRDDDRRVPPPGLAVGAGGYLSSASGGPR